MKSRAEYDRALQVVGTVIRAWDPYCLLASGSPKDEFDAEIARVVTKISGIKSSQDAAVAVSDVFSSCFEGDRFTPEDCAEVGAELFKALSDNGII